MEQWLRLIKIIQHLVRRESLTVRDLHGIFGGRVAVRTLQRDMEKLIAEPEIPVALVQGQKGRAQRFHIESWFKDKFSKSALDVNEAIAGRIAMQNLGIFRGTPLEESIRALEEKYSTLVPNDLFEAVDEQLGQLEGGFSSFQMGRYDYSEHGELIMQLIGALTGHRLCVVRYRKPHDKKDTEYRMFPLKMQLYKGSLYVYAKLEKSEELRLFVVHRIMRLDVLESTLTVTEKLKKDLRARERRGMGIYEENTLPAKKVRLLFDPRIAHRIRGRLWHASQHIVDNSDGSLAMDLSVPVTEELIGWLLHWQASVTVQQPAELVRIMRERIESMHRLYDE